MNATLVLRLVLHPILHLPSLDFMAGMIECVLLIANCAHCFYVFVGRPALGIPTVDVKRKSLVSRSSHRVGQHNSGINSNSNTNKYLSSILQFNFVSCSITCVVEP